MDILILTLLTIMVLSNIIFDINKSINGIIRVKRNKKKLKKAYKNKEWENIAKYSRFKRYGILDMIVFR